jgi:hypothetical protein
MKHSDHNDSTKTWSSLVTSEADFDSLLLNTALPRRVFAKAMSGDRLLLASTSSVTTIVGGGPLELVELDLPKPEDAVEWWRKFWDGHSMLFLASESMPRIVIAVKASAWNALPDHLTDVPKRSFRSVSEEELCNLLGSDASRVLHEAAAVGLSVRLLYGPHKS